MGAGGGAIGSTLVWRPDAAGTTRAFTTVDWCDPGQGEVAVADSFRLDRGRIRGVAHHRERFLASAAMTGPGELERASAFWDDALAALRAIVADDPEHPALFPRLERRERGEFRLLVRPSPPIVTGDGLAAITVATAAHDPRRTPRVKGPDLERLAALRTQAQLAGADEAVIVDARGRPVEGAYSSLLIARDGRLAVIGQPAPRIPSVTERLVRDAARTHGLAVDEARPTVGELAGASLWVLSALHGARAVERWVEGPVLVRDDERDAWLRHTLANAATAL